MLGFHEEALAQPAFIFPSTVQVAGGSLTESVTVTIQSAGSLAAVHVVTQGATNLDFNGSGIGSCITASYVQGQTCAVSVTFTPKYPGARIGAILLIADDGHVMATQYLSAVGTGGLNVVVPGQINTVVGDGCLSDSTCPSSGGTPATQSALKLPLGVVTDVAGNLYVSDTGGNSIRRIDLTGNIATIANNSGVAGSSGDGGSAVSALINQPSAIAIDGAGNVVFADTGNSAIRKIDATTGNISTIAGTLGSSGFGGEGQAATTALLSSPQGFGYDKNGNLFIADTGNNRIRKVDASSQLITTIAGNGGAGFSGDGSAAISAQFDQPWGLTISINGSIYIADFANNRVRKIDGVTGDVTTVAGNGSSGFAGDGGPATAATLNSPASVITDPAGNFYIADSENNVIRKVNVAGVISTIAGNGTALFGGDGFSAALAGLYKPYSVYLDGAGNLFLADRLDLRIREISASTGSLQYPTLKEGKISSPIAQKLENDGNTPLNLFDLTAEPATQNAALDLNPTDPITTTCSTSHPLGVDGSCILAVEFAPITVGTPGTGVLSVTSDAGNNPTGVDLTATVLSVDPSSTTVTSSLNPAGVGLAVTFAAHIASPNQVTGTVQFFDGSTPIGVPQPVDPSSDTATITTSFSVLQGHTITAAYSGDNLNAASSPNHPLIETIEQTTSLNVIPSANPVAKFVEVTFAATVAGWIIPPAGVISFSDGSVALGASTLSSNGTAFFTMPLLPVGTHDITATFAGDANDFTSSYSFVQTINLAPTSTILSTSSAVAQFGTPITLTATVTGVSASIPTGAVNIMDGTIVLASIPLNGAGVATYINASLTSGTHTITAVYQGDVNYATSKSTQIITETISQTPTVTALSSSTTSSLSGRAVVLSASVTAAGGSPPTGTIAFMNDNVSLGTANLSHGTASLSVSNLSVGTDNLTAIYSGDSNDVGSRSRVVTIVVLQTPTSTAVSSSQSPLPTLTSVVISAAVSNGGSISPTGLVTFSEDSISIGVGTLDASGVATISIPSLPAGSHTFTASYAGDIQDIPSTSGSFVLVVQPRSTTDILTTSATSLSGGQQLTLISVVRAIGTPPATGPTGTVTFLSGSTTLATTPVDATGVATVTVILSGSTATISSTYGGDANYAPSSSSPTQVTIGPAPDFSLGATPSTFQMQTKQHSTIALTLTSVKNFTDVFSLGCLGLPQNATCTFSKDQAELPAGGVLPLTVIVDTNSALLSGTEARLEPRSKANTVLLACSLPGLLGLGLLAFRARRSGFSHSLIVLVALCMVALGIAGCGNIQSIGTPPGTYNFVVNATGRTGVSQFVNMTMTITR
ncbi:Ig-like domain repeat protein [Granulicella sp. S190]|uniref:Ig-like domain repeat protein n=1 Tax=Granulicella sp. S190 TaxID=1747226 RepID=UPI001C20495F|nr:Ig-like domain repeat protein [Granulicella sp. S190]